MERRVNDSHHAERDVTAPNSHIPPESLAEQEDFPEDAVTTLACRPEVA